MRLNDLREYRPGLYTRLTPYGKPYDRPADIDPSGLCRMEQMIRRMARAEGVDETPEARDPMAWAAKMDSLRHRAEEAIPAERIYE